MVSTRMGLLLAALLLVACTRIPRGRSAVDRVEVVGNEAIDEDDIKEKIATAETPKFLGLFRGIVYEYELYDRNVLSYDLARVERYYRARGYYDAKARAGRVFPAGNSHIRIEIVVEEGKPVVVGNVDYGVQGAIDARDRSALERALNHHLAPGAVLDEDQIREAENEITRALEDRGYAKVLVAIRAEADIANHKARVLVDVDPAERCNVGKIRVEGVGSLPEHAVRRQLDLHEGEPYKRAKLDRAQQRLLDLGVVSSITISVEKDNAPKGVAPILVHLEPTKLRDLRIGGGFELDALKTDVHLRARWQDRNFLGDLRRFDIDVRPGLVLYPTRISDFRFPERLLPEARSRVELRQPGFVENLTTGFVRAEPNVYPVLIRTEHVEGEPILGYREIRTSEGIERPFGRFDVTLSHAFQLENPFSYYGPLDPSLETLVISYMELLGSLDLRNNPVHPHSGLFVSADLQAAGLGGQPRDVRFQPEVRAYIPVSNGVTIAARASMGALFPFNYRVGTDTRDVQIVFFRGFFSGGPSQNRGYPLRGIGPRGDVGFFNPIVNPCNAQQGADFCAVPLGGLSLWEASLEGRFHLGGPLEGVLFCDASDVAEKELTYRFDRPHLSCGLGARYDTPVGPLRLDVGYRIPGAQVASGQAVEPVPDLVKGVPIAIQVGLGEAF